MTPVGAGVAAIAGAIVLIAFAAPALGAPSTPHARLQAAIAAFDRYSREADPVTAGLDGDRAALGLWPDNSPRAVATRVAELKGIKARLAGLQGARLKGEDETDRAYLAWLVDDKLEGYAFDQAREPFSSDSGPFDTPDYAARSTAIHGEGDAAAWLARLKALPAYYETEIANARRGIATGFVQPRAIVEVALRAARARADEPAEQSALLIPFKDLPSSIPADRQAALRAEALQIVRDRIKPEEQAYVRMMAEDYLPKAPEALGVRSLPDGAAYYAFLVRHYTTTDLRPDQVHAIGVEEVARIRKRMDAVIAETGFKGSFADFLAFLRSDPRFYAKTPDELLERAAVLVKRIDDQLPGHFGVLPRLTFGVRPVPAELAEGYTSARYWQGSPDQGIPGEFMVNTSHLDQRPLYELPALALHEAIPGHHLQIALAQERKDLPFFRRNGSLDAYVEGWALYSEGLGEEMGIYQTPYERFGRLSMEMWRACRLVADTGIHWLGWTREEARRCFVENTALAPKNIDVELDRYISWPGQALAYKIGELRIEALRKKAEAALGPKFDLRRFHDAILLDGPLPLGLLESKIDAWIAARKAAP